ncbi:MAG: hypothetical protein HOM14_20225 [Gammaproteobacteria bacterium]|jgi:glutathione synthase/RimK-type ligase-like ATP-grasp enzyme|nr:hypothetical protein [Gammaproteobacteria bacterium]MBT3724334.1 hypothetical protein [Gammaproteobacteria bacterium]MBT4074983.1 hypothetical protein [Gammaproteobacteria bacterium]MBT4193597.1 hypothetical protein [Gammaproteobacteria bacterium]MBT4452038.1 hypothetical protein [Gammaproteobacteria bacterium]
MNSENFKQCAILSMDKLDDFESYDVLLDEPLANLGWKTHTVSWRDNSIDWNQFDVVVIRSTWDYQDDPELFIQQLKCIDQSSARLENPLELVLWNINKTYLKDLEQKGSYIVPTLWGKSLQQTELLAYFKQLQVDEIVIKPVISANADNTFRLTMNQAESLSDKLLSIFSTKEFMVQPFMQSIITEGEFSLFFFGGKYSHAILKKPKQHDFRVQEEHGGTLLKIEPEKALLQQAKKLNQLLSPDPLYSRLDFVRTQTGFAIMEVELIEPSLYFNMDQFSAERFANAFNEWMNKRSLTSV